VEKQEGVIHKLESLLESAIGHAKRAGAASPSTPEKQDRSAQQATQQERPNSKNGKPASNAQETEREKQLKGMSKEQLASLAAELEHRNARLQVQTQAMEQEMTEMARRYARDLSELRIKLANAFTGDDSENAPGQQTAA
jgi:hypothetical protein